MSVMFLQQLVEADSLQIDGDFVRHFHIENNTSHIQGDDLILDLNFLNGDGDEVMIQVTLDQALEAVHNAEQDSWVCAGYDFNLLKIVELGPRNNAADIHSQPMTRYDKQNATTRINGYYFPTTQEGFSGRHIEAFNRAKAETIKHMKAALRATESLSAADFFEERRKGYN
ncbi:hypothetical protein [Neptuniibacter halophilus]|uniref:hypothetical protein n=1 Tax=Neptuniibacter halophilus TaxID=651666 RepID=UPI0025722C4E|nr:hypothetical protein [Neptuniibacter halophilus]